MRNEFKSHSSAEVSFLVGSLPPKSDQCFSLSGMLGEDPRASPSSRTYLLGDPEQIAQILWASSPQQPPSHFLRHSEGQYHPVKTTNVHWAQLFDEIMDTKLWVNGQVSYSPRCNGTGCRTSLIPMVPFMGLVMLGKSLTFNSFPICKMEMKWHSKELINAKDLCMCVHEQTFMSMDKISWQIQWKSLWLFSIICPLGQK